MSGSSTVRLDDRGLPWEEIVISDSRPAVHRTVLHVERPGGASVQAVRFPPRWSREPAGYYDAAEEFVVVHGSLVVSGMWFHAGDYGFLPSRTTRTGSRAGPDGCLAVAWFDRPPKWYREIGVAEQPVSCRVEQARRRVGVTEAAWGVSRHVQLPREPTDMDVISPADMAWTWVPEGAAIPQLTRPLLVRVWSRREMTV